MAPPGFAAGVPCAEEHQQVVNLKRFRVQGVKGCENGFQGARTLSMTHHLCGRYINNGQHPHLFFCELMAVGLASPIMPILALTMHHL